MSKVPFMWVFLVRLRLEKFTSALNLALLKNNFYYTPSFVCAKNQQETVDYLFSVLNIH